MNTIAVALLLAAQAVAWAPLGSWSGDKAKKTAVFAVTADEWRVSWSAHTPDFAAAVWDVEKQTIVARLNGPSGVLGIRQRGRFSISIVRGSMYTITAEQHWPPELPTSPRQPIYKVPGPAYRLTPLPPPPPTYHIPAVKLMAATRRR